MKNYLEANSIILNNVLSMKNDHVIKRMVFFF